MEKLIAGAQKLNISLTSEQLEKFNLYYQELISWNKKINLTRITAYEEVVTKHFLDSLTAIMAWQPKNTDSILDVGTGAGLPGLPLKIVFPEFKLVLLEPTLKKITFLQYITQKLDLHGVSIVTGRAETIAHLPGYREKFDVVLARAVAELPTAVELTLPFCCLGGCFIAQKKGNIDEELNQALKAISILGGKFQKIKTITLEELPDNRQLVIIDKISLTPPQYPRRPGIPKKRPLK